MSNGFWNLLKGGHSFPEASNWVDSLQLRTSRDSSQWLTVSIFVFTPTKLAVADIYTQMCCIADLHHLPTMDAWLLYNSSYICHWTMQNDAFSSSYIHSLNNFHNLFFFFLLIFAFAVSSVFLWSFRVEWIFVKVWDSIYDIYQLLVWAR